VLARIYLFGKIVRIVELMIEHLYNAQQKDRTLLKCP